MNPSYLILGSKPGLEGEHVCGCYTSLPLARAAISWFLQREEPDATFRILEVEA